MALLNLDGLDDPIVVDACPGFAGGQRSAGPPDQLAQTEAAELRNIDLRDGTATTRRGTEALGAALPGPLQGLAWYDTPAAAYLVAAAGGGLKKWDGALWTTLSAYGAADSTRPVLFAQLIDRLYIADGASHLFSWDGTTLTNLGTGGAGQPPVGSLLISAQSRLWMAGVSAVADGLWVSSIINGAAWDGTNGMIRVGGGEGDPITGLAEWDDYQVVVFKRNSIYIVRADPLTTSGGTAAPLSNATVTKISGTIGCVSHRSIARVGGDLWFLSDGGVFSLGRVLALTQREVKPPASYPVRDVVDRIHWSAAGQAAAVYWNGRYLLSLPLDDDPQPATVLVWQTQQGAWSGAWTGWSPLCWALSRAGGEERLNFGRADGTVWRWLDYVTPGNEVESTFQDAGAPVPTRVTTRAMVFGDAVGSKSALSVQAEFYGSRAAASLALSLDEGEPIALQEAFATDPGSLRLSFMLPALLPGNGLKRRSFGAQGLEPFRSLQAMVSSDGGKLVLRAVIATAFPNTLRIEQ